MVHDVGSRNGVFIGEQKVKAAEVMPPAKVRIGRIDVEVLPGADAAETASADGVPGGYVGGSEKAQKVRALATRMAANDAPVLLQGETGTGKEVVARLIAQTGKRAGKPFVALNCGALSRTLIESELFGHEKGAFTGAIARKAGAFEQANGGTLFLDEIGELPIDLQPQLLRVLETGDVHRVGGDEDIHVDVRVIAATNRRLEEEVGANRFREDLFHRLHVLSLPLPPLRERASDVTELVAHFLAQLTPPGEKVRFDDAAVKLMSNHPWPGNVRELRNVVQRAVLMRSGDTLGVADVVFPPSTAKGRMGGDPRTLAEVERSTIVAELAKHHGNKTDAANALGISRSTIHRKIEEYNIDIDGEVGKADGK
jgi:DNA-binding NtrC family response regulator